MQEHFIILVCFQRSIFNINVEQLHRSFIKKKSGLYQDVSYWTMEKIARLSVMKEKRVMRGCSRARTQMRARYASVSSRAGT